MMIIPTGTARTIYDPSHTAITYDGNSIIDPTLPGDLVLQLAAMPPISNALTISNIGKSGQTIRQMIATRSDVLASFVPGRRNILIAFEITNSIFNGVSRTGLQAIADLAEYIAAAQADVAAAYPGQKWTVIVQTAIPRGDYLGAVYTAQTGEVELQAANAALRADYRSMGATALVESRRQGGIFDFTDSHNGARFPSTYWRDRTHPNAAGDAVLAGYVADVLKTLPAR